VCWEGMASAVSLAVSKDAGFSPWGLPLSDAISDALIYHLLFSSFLILL